MNHRVLMTVVGLTLLGCGAEDASLSTRMSSLEAFCTAEVRGVGGRDVEMDYLPHVVACENGAADFEALKAQAVSARSYLYYKLETSGDIADGTGDQVFSCGRPPTQVHYDAVAATAGEVLMYDQVVVAAFYVAGAIPSTADCVPLADDSDPTGTEGWVTYNAGLSGRDIQQTHLGWIDPDFPRNRGCKSQNGAHCLAVAGWGYHDILRFYYGEDIGIERAEGPCVDGASLDAGLDAEVPAEDTGLVDAERPEAVVGDAAVGPEWDAAADGGPWGFRPDDDEVDGGEGFAVDQVSVSDGGCAVGTDQPAGALVLAMVGLGLLGLRARRHT